jgi:hypothetical protein
MLALFFCFQLAHVSAHGVQVAHCQLSNGTLRVFVEHLHGYSSASYLQSDQMTIQVGANTSNTLTLSPKGNGAKPSGICNYFHCGLHMFWYGHYYDVVT